MESAYQSCVTEFDLDLLEHGASDNQTSLAVPSFNVKAKKKSVYFLKLYMKQFSERNKLEELNRASENIDIKNIEQHLLKNEEFKDICKERNEYYQQAMDYANENEKLKTDIKLLEEKYSEAMNTVAATEVHSMQFKELTKELQNVLDNQKKIEKDRGREKRAKEIVENKLRRILSEFIAPNKKSNKWIQNLKRKYGTAKVSNVKDEESSGASSADEMFDDITITMSPLSSDSKSLVDVEVSKASLLACDSVNFQKREDDLSNTDVLVNKTTIIDFENVQSVDTGRGSSLMYSDGEKSSFSPVQFCCKCNKSKSDFSTSPIPPEMLDEMEIKLIVKTDESGIKKNTKDASTTTLPRRLRDVATDTSDLSMRIINMSTSPVKIVEPVTNVKTNVEAEVISPEQETGDEVLNNSNILDEDTSTILLSSNTTSNVELYICENSLDQDGIPVDSKDINEKTTCSKWETQVRKIENSYEINTDLRISLHEEDPDNIDERADDITSDIAQAESPRVSPTSDEWESSTELPSIPAKTIENIKPNLEFNFSRLLQETNHEMINENENIINSNNLRDVTNSDRLSSITEDEETIVHVELNKESEANNNTILTNNQENNVQKCLELNNSNNLNKDSGNDNEIQMIINKMKFRQPLITPLPRTPKISDSQALISQKKILKNVTKNNNNNVKSSQHIEDIDEYLNEIRHKMRESLGAFMPDLVGRVINKISKEKNNQHLLHCLLQEESEQGNEHDGNTSQRIVQKNHEEIIEISNNIPNYEVNNQLAPTQLSNTNNKIIYESADCESDDNTCQQNWETDNFSRDITNDNTSKENMITDDFGQNPKRRGAKRMKQTKLQKLKMNMMPKNKIKQAHGITVKKLKYKPKPVVTMSKRKITDADTSATLNDRDVYEKAVKIISESKSKKYIYRDEARVIVEDCLRSPKQSQCENESQTLANNNVLQKPNLTSVNNEVIEQIHQDNDNNGGIKLKTKRQLEINSTQATLNNEIFNKDIESVDEPSTKKRRIDNLVNSKQNINNDILYKKGKQNRNHCTDNTSISTLSSSNSPSHKMPEIDLVSTNNSNSSQTDLSKDNEDFSKKDEPSNNNTSPVTSSRRYSTRRSSNTNSPCNNIQAINEDPDNNSNHKLGFKRNRADSAHNTAASSQRVLRSSFVKQENCVLNKHEIHKHDCNEEVSKVSSNSQKTYKYNILRTAIEKYGVRSKNKHLKINESIVDEKWDKLEKSLESIVQMSNSRCTDGMNKLISEICSWNYKHFIMSFMKYLKNPQRKFELFNKTLCPPAPPMTKKEQVLIYVLDQLQNNWGKGIVEKILENIEYTLFALNRTPETNVIEAMAHFYALVCRFYHKQSKLRLFMIDAMYCLSYKSIPLVMQCLEEWMFILPLGHMGLAKTPLVSCLVYLLHFYKCERDARKCVQELRSILHKRYYYDFSDWNETKILDMFRTSIKELRDNDVEKKMLRMALIILAKRNGPKWCQSHIINNMLQPLIENENTSDTAKLFCILALGPLVKPYPNEMKSYCEIVTHYLIKKLEQNNSQKMQEAIVSSLLFMNKHDTRVNDFLLKWSPDEVSPEFENILRDYVRSKTVKAWKYFLTNNFNTN